MPTEFIVLMSQVLPCVLFGIASTTQLHLAKAMERQGIEVFDQIRAKLKKEEISPELGGKKKPLIYIIAMILNNTVFLYMIASALFGPASYFTSMFGVGLVFLMIYSAKVLRETIQRIEYVGSLVLVVGTLVLGLEAIFFRDPSINYSNMNISIVWLFFTIFLGIGAIFMSISFKTKKATGVIFGLFAGGCATFDPFFKALGQQLGGTTGLLPSTPEGWSFFIPSFLVAVGSFVFTQWGFARKARASVLVPTYNSIYVILPIVIQLVAWPGFGLFWSTYLGLGLVIVGIVLMQAFKRPPMVAQGVNIKKIEAARVP